MSTSHEIMQRILDSSLGGFPPSFEGNPWIFMSALFCTMVASLISIVQIYGLSKEIIHAREIVTTPINIYRWQLILAYLTIVFACGPDAVYLWTYNEISASATTLLLNIDRIFDSIFLIPMVIFTWLQLRCGATIRYHLLSRATPITLPSDKTSMRLNIMVIVMIFVMSLAVTISK